LEAAFGAFGWPERIRPENGAPLASAPLASKAPGGLSRLSIWWLKLGPQPERIPPGPPQTNGRHERFHRTLKAETAKPAARQPRQQQQRFPEWGQEFNQERPHEALGYAVPAQIDQTSCREYPRRLPEIVDPDDRVLRPPLAARQREREWPARVRYGDLSAGGGETARARDERSWAVSFAHLKRALLDTHKMPFQAARHQSRRSRPRRS
jgi:hypothetical protein